MQVKAFAKINLLLNVLFKREDGYHELQSIMQSISLYDLLTFSSHKSEIKIQCTDPEIAVDQRNTVYQAAALLKDRFSIKNGVNVHIKKDIPWGAGLAGGSADAAATLLALNKLWDLKLIEEELIGLGAQIGSDVPFCLKGGTVLVEGRGERIRQLSSLTKLKILLIIPDINVSTAWVYKQIPGEYKKAAQNMSFFNEISFFQDADKLKNDLEQFTIKKYPQIKLIIEELKSFGAAVSLMSGSGAAVFGVFKDEKSLENAFNELKKKYKKTCIVGPEPKGLSIAE